MMGRYPALCLCAAVCLLAAAVRPADACSSDEWPEFQPRLDASPSNSQVTAVQPTLPLSPAPTGTAAERAEYGGLWKGWMCRNKACDVAVAVARVTNDGAEVEFSSGDGRYGRFSNTLSMKFEEGGEVLCGEFPSGQALMLGLRGDGQMNVMWAHPGKWWRSGIMQRTQAPPAS